MDETETPTMEEIKQMLERLKALDQHYWVFGAQMHQYKSYPLSIDEIESFEVELRIRLPADYRQFLYEIGYGAGPYYGLYSPKYIFMKLGEGDFYKDERFSDLSKPFPFTRKQADEIFRITSKGCHAVFEADCPTDGCIPVCFEDRKFQTILVTAGELTGSLWSHDPEHEVEGWNLAPPPPSLFHKHPEPAWHSALSPRPTFLEWYSTWLTQCLSDFEELRRDVSRRHPKNKK